MVRELEKKRQSAKFPETAPAANPVFFRTYSRRTKAGLRETWDEVCDRTLLGLVELGKLTQEEAATLDKMQRNLKAMPSGRWLWVGGTDWITKPKNFSGAYNCTSTNLEDWSAFGLMMDLAMMGCGTGAVLEPQFINQLPPIRNQLNITVKGEIGSTPVQQRREYTQTHIEGNNVTIHVGDSREGWVESYQTLLELSTDEQFSAEVKVLVDISDVRKAGETLNGFGGVANPVKLPVLYQGCASILNKARGRQLNSVECCLLIDQAAVTIVAGNIRRSAGMRQFIADDQQGATAKDNLWQQDESGNWRIDPERDALRMANHTRVFHRKPTLEECLNAVRKQYYSGEGAIQWAGEAVARSNIDLLPTQALKVEFLQAYEQGTAKEWLKERHSNLDANELEHRLQRYALNPCGEIIGANFHCVSGDTLLITRDGIHKIKDVIGSEIEIWNGQKWSQVTPFKTGSDTSGGLRQRKLYRVKFADGTYLDATEYHRFFVKDRFDKEYKEVQTKDLMDVSRYAIHTEPFTIQHEDGLNIDPNYAYTLGIAVGDGTTDQNGNAKVRLYKQKATLSVIGSKSPERNYDYLPTFTDVTDLGFSGEFLKSLKTNPESLNVIASWNRQAILHFIAGLADTDGTNTHSNGIRIYISDYERAYRVQLLLTKCGIRSSLNLCAHKGSVTNYGVRSQDLYYLQITDCRQIPCQRLDVSKGCDAKHKGKWQIVRGVEELPGLHDTYCFNEPEYHKGVFGNTLTGNCNLSEVHLNQIDPRNYKEQEEAFTAGALSVAALLNHKFLEPRYQYSRELDPIVGVSFTGLFDFFVHAFGVDWLRWWEAGRPATPQGLAFKREEEKYLSSWKDIVHRVVWDYCDRHNLKRPNRCTTVQPSGTKALLTNASSGWHPPKAQRFIRRITFGKNDPVALACIDYGYNVIPSQSDKDEQGNLLNDPFDPRVSEWLVEIPVSVSWADLPGADEIDVSKFSVLAQFDFVLQVQRWYVTHNTSATLELRSDEIEPLAQKIYETIQSDRGYISAALLARFDDLQSFPRLPFEPIDKLTYERLNQEVKLRRKTDDFCAVLSRYDLGEMSEAGPSGCDSDKCMFPDREPSS
ncbi:ribonucleoside-triphosphate reductase, adenosylcobalamin-dependent [Nostoc sp. 'Peltigera membranacea cyanobiont' 213]|uniref:ribonucleoside-triphosphate reductase, adenosylcobalamin-dependent n=1 Tax=Nostoc sp. 'Peltigera membranacea cyanobiont' 213 TaxID=2014530 RepID=UPI000B954E0C|nr:ribonucleoside-triphosphate reductase, adenosylcobalamin-dependent [Nostoc sp. 'Peltigera membranacea cyanobiont' 213]OYD94286.1 ribonucleoside-triphosphate reductase, adenosylcobalamin-dependent [Nostoc sp. 'Peltigera membranacea cyanobiont' 213]